MDAAAFITLPEARGSPADDDVTSEGGSSLLTILCRKNAPPAATAKALCTTMTRVEEDALEATAPMCKREASRRAELEVLPPVNLRRMHERYGVLCFGFVDFFESDVT